MLHKRIEYGSQSTQWPAVVHPGRTPIGPGKESSRSGKHEEGKRLAEPEKWLLPLYYLKEWAQRVERTRAQKTLSAELHGKSNAIAELSDVQARRRRKQLKPFIKIPNLKVSSHTGKGPQDQNKEARQPVKLSRKRVHPAPDNESLTPDTVKSNATRMRFAKIRNHTKCPSCRKTGALKMTGGSVRSP